MARSDGSEWGVERVDSGVNCCGADSIPRRLHVEIRQEEEGAVVLLFEMGPGGFVCVLEPFAARCLATLLEARGREAERAKLLPAVESGSGRCRVH